VREEEADRLFLVLKTIKCLLIYPNPESALDEEAGKQLLADYDGYCKV
jgi:ubiquitin-conjugating enzyme E2 S